ncbi:hypothetical protein L2E82_30835 [Cichorium intybus]|uniref:Uncharacterized protein n=1 Tax=Cichorium intybus TaxID=13427 RepID=A0ACB9D1Q2_CICIN|nr:hypothetical protein L2E82_30835 [Cichorium intybus]
MAESNMVVKEKHCDPGIFSLWHDRLGHPGLTMMRRIIENTHGHPLKDQKFPQSGNTRPCTSCSLGKLIIKPSPVKVEKESPRFLERIQGDICGPIHPPSGPFRYFMVLIDASSKWSHVCLLSTRNMAFAKFLTQIIKLRAHLPDHDIKRVRLDNAGEFTSQAFNDYCMSVGIVVEHPVAHVHTQNGLAESLIKRLQLIARPLMTRTKLPVSVWGDAILHAASLIRIRPSAYHTYSPQQLAFGQEPDISHLRIFGCAVYVPIAPPQRTKMGPQRRLGIYVGYETSSIIRYLEPLTGDVFTARLADCQFNETIFPSLGGEKKIQEKDVSWHEPSLSYLDPYTKQRETEVQKIMYFQEMENRLPDAFIDTKRVTKSYIPAVNAPARIDIPDGQSNDRVTQESKIRLKRGRPFGSKDKNPRKRRGAESALDHMESVPGETQNIMSFPREEINDKEIAIHYGHTNLIYDQSETDHINEMFCYSVACDIMNDDLEPQSVMDCQNRHDWVKWKEAMQAELTSLNKRKVFGPIILTPRDVKPLGYRLIFVRKRNEKDEIVRYKARLVAQGFSQRPGIDYEETYSPVMYATTFRYLISLEVSKNLEMCLMDVVTAYLYGSLDSDIYMKIPEGFKMPKALSAKPKEMYSIKLQRSLYGLKQSGRMWYNRLSDYLTTVYVDDLNIIGTNKEILEVIELLKKEFEMKDLGKTKYCLGLQIEHMPNGILVHQSNYIEKVLKRFNMDKAKSLSTPMVVRSLNIDKDPFRQCEENEEVLGPEVPYLNAIGALMYLTNCTRPDISFAVNLLARFSSSPTKRHWKGIKHIFRYLRGTTDLGLFYPNNSKQGLVGYADAGYLSDPHKAKSQTRYVFMNGDKDKAPTSIYEDNAACVTQKKEGYIKSDRTKHIPPKFFKYPQELIKKHQVEIKYVQSSNNVADLFTKALPTAIFRKHFYSIGMRHVHNI